MAIIETLTGTLRVALGALATPSFSFVGDANTGIYSPGADQVNLVCGGADILLALTTQIQSGIAGTAGAPAWSWIGDPDTGFYNSAANKIGIAVGGAFKAEIDSNGSYTLKSSGGFQAINQASAAWQSFRTKLAADADYRLDIMADGSLRFGDGTNAWDTLLSRTAVGVLTVDGSGARARLAATDGITTKVKAGTIADADFSNTPASGTIAVDTTNSLLYVRVGSTWKSVALV